MLIALKADLRGRDPLLALFGLVLGVAFLGLVRVLLALLAVVVALAFLGLASLALVRFLVASPAERR